MSIKSKFALLGLAAGSALAFSAIPAQAATISFGTGGIKFDKDTVVDFTFLESHGGFKSTLSVFNVTASKVETPFLFKENQAFITPPTDDFVGLCPQTVTSPAGACTTWFTFKGGVEYSLILDSTPDGVVYSTTALNPDLVNPPANPGNSNVQAGFTFGSPNPGIYTIGFDDDGAGPDEDFNDFIITAQIKDVPEPTALAGLALVGGALVVARRRKSDRPS